MGPGFESASVVYTIFDKSFDLLSKAILRFLYEWD